MSRRALLTALSIAGVIGLLALLTSGDAVSQSTQPVVVTNFPDPQNIRGQVQVTGAVRLSEMASFTEILVPPVGPADTTRLVDAGTLVSDGFASVVLSLHGQTKGSPKQEGRVGAFLVPVEQTIEEAFNELGLVHFALEVTAPRVSASTPFFASQQPRYTVGFRSYKVLFYNTTDKTVTVNLYAYLTS